MAAAQCLVSAIILSRGRAYMRRPQHDGQGVEMSKVVTGMIIAGVVGIFVAMGLQISADLHDRAAMERMVSPR